MKLFNKNINRVKIIAFLAVLTMPAASGMDFISIDYLTTEIPPQVLIFIRMFLAAITLFIVLLIREGGLHIEKKDMPKILLTGGFGLGLYYVVEAIGIDLTSASLASILFSTLPVWGLIGDKLIFKVRLNAKKITAVLTSIGGVFIVIAGTHESDMGGSIKGVILILFAAIIWVGYLIVIKPYTEKYSSMSVTTTLFFGAAILNFPIFICYKPESILMLSGKGWLVLIVSTIFFLTFGSMLYLYGVGKLSTSVATVVLNLIPLFTVIFAYILFKEVLTLVQLMGGAVILASVIAITLIEEKDV